MLERDDHRTYTHESALTRRMWYSTVTPTDPDMRRVSWGQSAQTTTTEVSFALLFLYIYIRMSIISSQLYSCSIMYECMKYDRAKGDELMCKKHFRWCMIV